LVYPFSLAQPNKRDKPTKPVEPEKLVVFFTILLKVVRAAAKDVEDAIFPPPGCSGSIET
jgi:hypothetical protein